jgi:hypothetical protein
MKFAQIVNSYGYAFESQGRVKDIAKMIRERHYNSSENSGAQTDKIRCANPMSCVYLIKHWQFKSIVCIGPCGNPFGPVGLPHFTQQLLGV